MQRPLRGAFFRDLLFLVGAIALTSQWVVVHHIVQISLGPVWDTVLPGLAIFGAATLLSWGAELAQIEMT